MPWTCSLVAWPRLSRGLAHNLLEVQESRVSTVRTIVQSACTGAQTRYVDGKATVIISK